MNDVEAVEQLDTIDPDRLVSPPSTVSDLLCPICLELPLKPVQLKCEHIFCRIDITEYLLHKNSACPSCKQPATPSDIAPVGRFIQNTVNSLDARCQHNPEHIIKLENLARHQAQECEVECPNGCGQTVTRGEGLKRHLENECGRRIIACPSQGCPIKLQALEMKEHLEQCGYVRIDCPNGCGLQVPRSANHNCVKGLRAELENYRIEQADKVKKLERDKDDLTKELNQIKEVSTSLSTQMKEMVAVISSLQEIVLEQVPAKVTDLEKYIERLAERHRNHTHTGGTGSTFITVGRPR